MTSNAIFAVLGLSFFAGIVTTEFYSARNQWAEAGGPQVGIVLTDSEREAIAEWIIESADGEVIERLRNLSDWQDLPEDATELTAGHLISLLKEVEFAGGRACLWCLEPKGKASEYPHYRIHKPNCPVDAVASGNIYALPIEGTGTPDEPEELRWDYIPEDLFVSPEDE